MTSKRVDPQECCIDCGRRYGSTEETCSGCGFNPIDGGEDEARQIKAESDFSAWQNERPDHDE